MFALLSFTAIFTVPIPFATPLEVSVKFDCAVLAEAVVFPLPPGQAFPLVLHISLILPALLTFVTFSVPLAPAFTLPVKYSTLVSAPPVYLASPHVVSTLTDERLLFALSTISSKIRDTVKVSPAL